jgi:hypothetical protein
VFPLVVFTSSNLRSDRLPHLVVFGFKTHNLKSP